MTNAPITSRTWVKLLVVVFNLLVLAIVIAIDNILLFPLLHITLFVDTILGVFFTEFSKEEKITRILDLAKSITRTGQLSVSIAAAATLYVLVILFMNKEAAISVLDELILPGTGLASFLALISLFTYPLFLQLIFSWRRKEELSSIIYRAIKESSLSTGVRPAFLTKFNDDVVEDFRVFLHDSFPSLKSHTPNRDEWFLTGLNIESMLASLQLRARNDPEMHFIHEMETGKQEGVDLID